MTKNNMLNLYVKLSGIRSIKRATKAIKKMAKAMEQLNNSTNKANAAFLEMKNNIPILLECEVENEDEQTTR